MLRDLDTKIKQKLNINRFSPYYNPFLPSGFKLGYVTPNEKINCIQIYYYYGGKEIEVNFAFIFVLTNIPMFWSEISLSNDITEEDDEEHTEEIEAEKTNNNYRKN